MASMRHKRLYMCPYVCPYVSQYVSRGRGVDASQRHPTNSKLKFDRGLQLLGGAEGGNECNPASLLTFLLLLLLLLLCSTLPLCCW
jgi:hypothetical protein